MSQPSGRPTRWAIGALAGALVIATGVASAAKLSTKSETATLPGDDATHSVTAQCPSGTKSTGGGIQLSDDRSDYVQGFYPVGKREWTAAAARFLDDDAEFTAFIRCVKNAKVSTETATASIPNSNGAGNPTGVATATCPKGSKVTGGGLRLEDDSVEVSQVNASFPSGKRKWTVDVEAYGEQVDVVAFARCLKKAKVLRRSETIEFSDDGEEQLAVAKCPKGTRMTGGGVELSSPYNDYPEGSYPTGKRAWTAVGLGTVGETFTAHVLCLKKPKKK